jgi:ketosteroid isomerase-like protein
MRGIVLTALTAAASLMAMGSAPAQQVRGAPEFRLTPGAVQSQALTDAIAKADLELFDVFFIQCDADKVATLVTEDMEFFHDKSGFNAKSGAEFAAQLRDGCQKQAAGTNFRARRELVDGSVQVYPLNNYGALSMGTHRFYARIPGKPDTLTETAKFITVWRKDGDKWLMARAISYDHVLAK